MLFGSLAANGLIVGIIGGIVSALLAGPSSVLIITRGLQGKIQSSRVMAVGCSLGEACYACLAFYGVAPYVAQYPVIGSIASSLTMLICFGLGVSLLNWQTPNDGTDKKDNDREEVVSTSKQFFHWLAIGLSMTGLNPSIIVTWAGVTAYLVGAEFLHADAPSVLFGAGVGIGSALYFNVLLTILGRYSKNLSDQSLKKCINGLGIFVLIIGLNLLYGVVKDYMFA